MPKGQHLRLLEYVIARLSCMQMGEFSGRKIYTVIRYGDLRIWDSGISRNIYIYGHDLASRYSKFHEQFNWPRSRES